MGACSGEAWVALGNWRAPKALQRELQIPPSKKRKAVLTVRFLVCIQDPHKCCHMLGCCRLTAPVSFRAGEEERPSSLLQLLNSNAVLSTCSPCPCWYYLVQRLEQSSRGWAVVCSLTKHETQQKMKKWAADICCLNRVLWGTEAHVEVQQSQRMGESICLRSEHLSKNKNSWYVI